MGDRFYMQQGVSVSDFKLGTFKNKPTKAAVLADISKVLHFVDAKTFANTTTLANMLEVIEWLKAEPFAVTAPVGKLAISNKKQTYIDAIGDCCTFNDHTILKMFTLQGLRDLVRFINEQAANS